MFQPFCNANVAQLAKDLAVIVVNTHSKVLADAHGMAFGAFFETNNHSSISCFTIDVCSPQHSKPSSKRQMALVMGRKPYIVRSLLQMKHLIVDKP